MTRRAALSRQTRPAGRPTVTSVHVPTRRDHGFTLIELLAVLTIIAVGTYLTSAAIMRPSGTGAVRSAAVEIAQLARGARSHAITHGDGRLVVDLVARTIRNDAGHSLVLAPDVTLELTSASAERLGTGQGVIRFFANGSSSGGTIRLLRGAAAFDVRINWFTGRVAVAP